MVASPIDKDRPRTTEILRAHGLTPLRAILTPQVFREIYPITPPGKTILIPEVVFWLMVLAAFGAGSMAGCIPIFWASLRAVVPGLPVEAVQEEAFSIARGKLPLRFFLRLFRYVTEAFSKQFDPRFCWKGRRLLAIDGMDVELPQHPRVQRVYPSAGNQHGRRGRPQARLVGLVGLWDGVCYAFRWTSLHVGEQASARRLMQHLRAGDLLLGDRNFPGKATFAAVLDRRADFLFHLPSNRFLKLARKPTPSNRREQWYSCITLGDDLQQQYPHLGPAITVRILQYRIPGFRPSWLITSLLDTTAYSYDELVSLYHERWRQETFHREWKHSLELSNLRSHSATGLLKEVLVQLTTNNVIRWVMAQAAAPPLCPVHLKFLDAKRLILASVPAMTAAPACLLPELYRQLLRDIGQRRILVRPGRSYPR
ncbi:hypothetical protein LCGC14_2323910, partial [marine sediment metagenome]